MKWQRLVGRRRCNERGREMMPAVGNPAVTHWSIAPKSQRREEESQTAEIALPGSASVLFVVALPSLAPASPTHTSPSAHQLHSHHIYHHV